MSRVTVRFPQRVQMLRAEHGTDGCWPWPSVDRYGYGKAGPNHRVQAHRMVYEFVVGPIPEGMTLDHLCHNPVFCKSGKSCLHRRCVNPAHLEPVTITENVLRGPQGFNRVSGLYPRYPRFIGPRLIASATHCAHGHPWNEENSRWRPNGCRECRACDNQRKRRQYQSSRDAA